MKKRIAACLLTLLLCLSLVPASAADTVYFTAMNDSLMSLSDSTMPYWSGGYLYVPASFFNGRDIEVYYSRSADKQTIILYTYTVRRALSFDLAGDATYDSYGNIYAERAQMRNGTPYVPVARVAAFFGLTYTNTKVTHGYLVRIKEDDALLSDKEFIEATTSLMESRYNEYKKPDPATTVPKPSEPTVPTEPEQTEEPETDGNRLYLCFYVQDVAAAEDLAGILSGKGAQATFYFPPALLASAGDLVRRIVSMGCSVGLTVDAASGAEAAVEELTKGNELLFQICGTKTRLVFLTNATRQVEEEIRGEGFCVLKSRVSYWGLTSSSGASVLMQQIGNRSGNVTVYLGSGTTASGLSAFLTLAREQEDQLLAVTETT